MKDSMILYTSYLERFKGLSDAQFGQFIRLLMAYQSTGEIPSIDDALVSLAFDMAKVDVDVNREKYENVVRRNQENGKKGGRPRKEEKTTGLYDDSDVPKKPSGLIEYPKNPSIPKKPDTDTDNDTDTVSDTDNVFSNEKPKEKDYFVVQRESERKRSEEVKQIVDAWNTLPNVAPVKSLDHNSKRYKMLCARLDDNGLDAVLTAIENVRFSKFLQGDNKRGWTIDFEWFVKPNNFPKVYEGNYTDRKPDSTPKAFKAIADMGWEDEEAKPIWEVLK